MTFSAPTGFRHTCFITNTEGNDIAFLELRRRGHARVEDRIRNWKDCGLSNLPFDSFVRNEAWVATSLVEYGESLLDDIGLAQQLEGALPEFLEPYVRIDVEGFARDLELSGDVTACPGDGGVYIFEGTV